MALKDILGESYKDGMTVEELETALAEKKLVDLSSGEYISKGKYADLDKKYKDMESKLKERMTAEEKQAEALAEREQYYKSLEKKLNLSEYNNKLSASIQDEKTRLEIAELMADGKTFEAIEKQNAYLGAYKETLTKQIREELLTKNPEPKPINNDTKDIDLSKMSYKELNKFQQENPELYEKLKQI